VHTEGFQRGRTRATLPKTYFPNTPSDGGDATWGSKLTACSFGWWMVAGVDLL
jgi:hypothetical protein